MIQLYKDNRVAYPLHPHWSRLTHQRRSYSWATLPEIYPKFPKGRLCHNPVRNRIDWPAAKLSELDNGRKGRAQFVHLQRYLPVLAQLIARSPMSVVDAYHRTYVGRRSLIVNCRPNTFPAWIYHSLAALNYVIYSEKKSYPQNPKPQDSHDSLIAPSPAMQDTEKAIHRSQGLLSWNKIFAACDAAISRVS